MFLEELARAATPIPCCTARMISNGQDIEILLVREDRHSTTGNFARNQPKPRREKVKGSRRRFLAAGATIALSVLVSPIRRVAAACSWTEWETMDTDTFNIVDGSGTEKVKASGSVVWSSRREVGCSRGDNERRGVLRGKVDLLQGGCAWVKVEMIYVDAREVSFSLAFPRAISASVGSQPEQREGEWVRLCGRAGSQMSIDGVTLIRKPGHRLRGAEVSIAYSPATAGNRDQRRWQASHRMKPGGN